MESKRVKRVKECKREEREKEEEEKKKYRQNGGTKKLNTRQSRAGNKRE